MNIPQSAIDPFGYTGMPFARGRYLMFRVAQRKMEILQCRAERWLSVWECREIPNAQLCLWLEAYLTHEQEWLRVSTHFSESSIYVNLWDTKYHIDKHFRVPW